MLRFGARGYLVGLEATRRLREAQFVAIITHSVKYILAELVRRVVHSQNTIRLRTMSFGHYRIARSSWRDGSFYGFLHCGRGSASALTSCWNLLPCAISLRCCSAQARGVHASARVSGYSGCSYRAGGQIGSAV